MILYEDTESEDRLAVHPTDFDVIFFTRLKNANAPNISLDRQSVAALVGQLTEWLRATATVEASK